MALARPAAYSFRELFDMQEELFSTNSPTTFVIAHVGSWPRTEDVTPGRLRYGFAGQSLPMDRVVRDGGQSVALGVQ